MSLIAKFSSIFNKKLPDNWKQYFEIQLLMFMKRTTMAIQAQNDFIEFLKTNHNYCEYLFVLLEEPYKLNYQPSHIGLNNLVSTIHSILIAHPDLEIAKHLKQKTITWIQNQQMNERLQTENSSSSIFQLQKENTHQKCNIITKQQMVQEKRNNRIQKNNLKPQIQLPQIPPPPPPPSTPQDAVKVYYNYVLKIAFNLDLYRSCIVQEYPYCEKNEEIDPKIKFLWLYKIQNIMQLGLQLKDQIKVCSDMRLFLKFVNNELQELIRNYKKLSNLETLSLFEIFSENERFLNFSDKQIDVDEEIMQEFIEFCLKIRKIEKNEKKRVQMKVLRQIDNIKVKIEHIEQSSGQPIISFLSGEEFLNNFNREKIEEEQLEDLEEQQEEENIQKQQSHDSACKIEELCDYPKNYEEQIAQKIKFSKFDEMTEQTNDFDDQDGNDKLI